MTIVIDSTTIVNSMDDHYTHNVTIKTEDIRVDKNLHPENSDDNDSGQTIFIS